jgi:hypothetical protein
MSIAVPIAIAVLLSAQVYGAWVWPGYESEQKDKSEQSDKSSEKDKSGKTDKSSSAAVSKEKQHSRKQRTE